MIGLALEPELGRQVAGADHQHVDAVDGGLHAAGQVVGATANDRPVCLDSRS